MSVEPDWEEVTTLSQAKELLERDQVLVIPIKDATMFVLKRHGEIEVDVQRKRGSVSTAHGGDMEALISHLLLDERVTIYYMEGGCVVTKKNNIIDFMADKYRDMTGELPKYGGK